MSVTFHTGLHSGVDVRWRHEKVYFENEEMIVAVNAIHAQLRKEAWKKFRTSTGFEPVTSRFTGAMLYQLSINNLHCDHFFIFISFSALHIWFISYIINKIYFENHIFLPIVRSRSGSTKIMTMTTAKTSLKKGIHFVSNLITLIPSRSIFQMLTN